MTLTAVRGPLGMSMGCHGEQGKPLSAAIHKEVIGTCAQPIIVAFDENCTAAAARPLAHSQELTAAYEIGGQPTPAEMWPC